MAFGADVPILDIQDVIVHDDYVIVKYLDTFQAYIRPKPEGPFVARDPLIGKLSISPSSDNSLVHKAELGMTIQD